MKKELIAHRDPKSPISEVFRTLRTNIQFMNTTKKMKTLLVTSTFPGEGKSWVSSNLAVTFAQAGNKVVLIDADMRKGRQYVIFEVSPRPGLSNCLVEMDIDNMGEFDASAYMQETDVENLMLISAGNVPPNPSELLVSEQMEKLLESLKEKCDLVIIDGTPCELVTDAVILSRIVDSTLIVTAYKQTKKETLQKIIKNIQNVGGKLSGVVLNKVPVSGKKYGEKYYYYGSTTNMVRSKNKGKRGKKESKNNTRFDYGSDNIENMKTIDFGDIEEEKKDEELEKPIFMNEFPSEDSSSLIDGINNNTDDSIFMNIDTNEGISVKVEDANNEETLQIENEIKKDEVNEEKTEDVLNTIDNTKDILNQINTFLDEEKKELD